MALATFLHYRKLLKVDLAVLSCLDIGKTTIDEQTDINIGADMQAIRYLLFKKFIAFCFFCFEKGDNRLLKSFYKNLWKKRRISENPLDEIKESVYHILWYENRKGVFKCEN